jgi:hypothetical protein
MRDLLTSLSEHPMALLRGIAELRGVELTSNARPDVAAQLAAALADPAATAEALTGCSAAGHAAWAALAAAKGRMKAATFTRSHGEIRPVGPGRLERELTWRAPASAAEELWYRGLIYRVFAEFGEGPLEYIYIPDELLPPGQGQAEDGFAAVPILMSRPALAEPRQARNTLAVDACTLLALARETPPAVDADGALVAGEARRLSAALVSADPLRLELLLTLGRGRGWLAADRARLVMNHRAAAAWLRGTHWEQMSALFTEWRDSVEWNDLRRVPSLAAEGEWRNDPVMGRGAVLDALTLLDPAAWYALDDLVAGVKAANPDFQRPDGNYSGWYLKDAGSGRYLGGFEAWDDVEGRLIRFLIEGPLFWLGALAHANGPAGERLFRLTRAGEAWLLGGIPAELPRPLRISVGEDFVVSAPLLTPLLDRFRLHRFTEARGAGTSDLTAATRTQHRITRGSLARARAAGIKAEAVLDFLKRAAGNRVPSKVAAAIARYDQLGGAARITKGAVLRVEDASVLATLRADPAIGRLLGDLISAQAVIVKEADLPGLLTLLAESGYEVKVD